MKTTRFHKINTERKATKMVKKFGGEKKKSRENQCNLWLTKRKEKWDSELYSLPSCSS